MVKILRPSGDGLVKIKGDDGRIYILFPSELSIFSTRCGALCEDTPDLIWICTKDSRTYCSNCLVALGMIDPTELDEIMTVVKTLRALEKDL